MWCHRMFRILYYYLGFILFLFHSLFLFIFFRGGSPFLLMFENIAVGFSDFSFYFILDSFSLGFVRFIFLISSMVFFYRNYYMGVGVFDLRFSFLLLFFIFSISILVLSPGILGILLGWDGLGVTSFLLVIYYINTSSLRSGLITVYTNRLGDMFLLLGLYCMVRNFSMSLEVFYDGRFLLLTFLFLLGGITKSAQLPFSSWLPAAMAAPTPVSSLVHSSTLVTAGVYLFVRYFFIMSYLLVDRVFCWVRIMTSFLAGLMAYFERDLRKLVAISTLSQLGIMMFICSLGEFSLCFFHIVSHALFKSLLFLRCGGLIMLIGGNQDIRFMGAFSFIIRVSLLLVLLSRLNLVGFPFISGFFSRDSILESSSLFEYNLFVLFMFFFSCIFSLVYRFKLLHWSFNSAAYWNGSFLYTYSDVSLWILRGVLLLWSIVLGKVLFGVFFEGECVLFSFFDKIQGLFILFFGCLFYFFFRGVILIKFINFYFIEIGYMNWFFGDLFRRIGFFLIVLKDWDTKWFEILGPRGIRKVLVSISSTFNFYKRSFRLSLVLLFIFIVFLIILLFSLFLKRGFEETENYNFIYFYFKP